MRILEFAEHLEKALLAGSIPKFLKNEEAFERDFVAPIAVAAAKDFPDVHLYTHSFGNRSMCSPRCADAEAAGNWLVGCPDCWTLSKSWGTVSAFSMRHTFDMVGRDRNGCTGAVEVKWMRFTGKRAPNGEFQRFLGQCAIAASRHDVVIGVAGIRGGPSGEELRYDEQREELLEIFAKLGVRLLILKAPEELTEVEIAATE